MSIHRTADGSEQWQFDVCVRAWVSHRTSTVCTNFPRVALPCHVRTPSHGEAGREKEIRYWTNRQVDDPTHRNSHLAVRLLRTSLHHDGSIEILVQFFAQELIREMALNVMQETNTSGQRSNR